MKLFSFERLILCMFILVFIILPVSASEILEDENFTYTVNSDGVTATITGYTGTDQVLTIPVKLDSYTVTVIGTMDGAEEITSVTIHELIDRIDASAFSFCQSLTDVYYTGTLEEWCGIVFMNISANPVWKAKSLSVGGGELSELQIPSSLHEIRDYTFAGCETLTEIRLPDTILSIGQSAFEGCTNIRTVSIPQLTSDIASRAFAGCTALTEVWLGASVETFANDAFAGCTALETFEISGFNSLYTTIDGLIVSKDGTRLLRCPEGYGKSRVNIPYGIRYIAPRAFEGNTTIVSITIPGTVTEIGSYAFSCCLDLEEVYMEDSVTKIGQGIFYICPSLVEAELSDNIRTIPSWAFAQCQSLSDVKLPLYLESIETFAFYECGALSAVYIPPYIERMGRAAFLNSSVRTAYFLGGPPYDWGEYLGVSSGAALSKWVLPEYTTIYGNPMYGWEPISSLMRYWQAPCGSCKYTLREYYPDSAEYGDIPIAAEQDYVKMQKGKFIVKVLDRQTGIPLNGALVTFGDKSDFTNAAGKVSFDIPETDTVFLQIEAAGYIAYKLENYGGYSERSVDLFEMAVEGTYAILPMTCNGAAINTSTSQINRQADLTAEIVLEGNAPSQIIKYELRQQNSIIGESTDGVFRLHNSRFLRNIPITAYMYTEDGKVTTLKLNIDVVSFTFDAATSFFPFSGTTLLQVPSDVAFLGGLQVELKAGIVSMTYEVSNDKLKIGFNFDVTKYDAKTLLKNFRDQYDNAKNVPGPQANVTFEIGGYYVAEMGNYGVHSEYGEVIISAHYNNEFSQTFYPTVVAVVVPIQVELELDILGQVRVSNITFDYTNAKLKYPELDLIFSGSATGRGGIGCDYVSTGFYGKLGTELAFKVFPQFMVDSWKASGEIGVYAKAQIEEFNLEAGVHIPVVKGQITFYDRERNNLSESGNLARLYEAESYTVAERTWDTAEQIWNTDVKEGILQTDIYTSSDPQLAEAGETTVMMFLADNSGTDEQNFQQLVYSVQTENGWSEPMPVDTDNYIDADFTLYTNGEEIHVVYSEANRLLTEQDEAADYAASMEIKTARYDPETGSFTDNQILTDNKTYDINAVVVSVGDSEYLVWVNNENNDLFGLTYGNTIRMSRRTDGIWSEAVDIASSLPTIVSITVGTFDGAELVIAAIHDTDCDLYTDTDRVLTLYYTDGTSVSYDTGEYINPVFEQNRLYWYSNNRIVSTDTPGEITETVIADLSADSNPDFRVVTEEEMRVVLYRVHNTEGENGGSDLYAVCSIDGEEWNLPVRITFTDGYVDSGDALITDNGLLTVFRRTDVIFTEESFETSSDLRCALVRWNPLPEIIDVDYDYFDLYDDGELTLHVTVKNNGLYPVHGLTVNAETFTAELPEAVILPGYAEEFEIVYPLPTSVSEEIALNVSAMSTEETLLQTTELAEDNATMLRIGYADLAVFAEWKSLNETPYLSISLKNLGNILADGVFSICETDKNGDLLYRRAVTLDAGEELYILLELTQSALSDQYYGDTETLYLKYESNSVEYDLTDNETLLELFYTSDLDRKTVDTAAAAIQGGLFEAPVASEESLVSAYVQMYVYEQLADLPGTEQLSVSAEHLEGRIYRIIFTQGDASASSEIEMLRIGDSDGDGDVDSEDVLMLAGYFAGWSGDLQEEIPLSAVDMNFDNQLTRADAMILARYEACWSEYMYILP